MTTVRTRLLLGLLAAGVTAPAAPAAFPVALLAPLLKGMAGAAAAGAMSGGDKQGGGDKATPPTPEQLQARSKAALELASQAATAFATPAPKLDEMANVLKAMDAALGDVPAMRTRVAPLDVMTLTGASNALAEKLMTEPPAPPVPPPASDPKPVKRKWSDSLTQGRDRPPVLLPADKK